MRAARVLLWTEVRLFLREPAAVFFTLVFPVMIVVLFAHSSGSRADPRLHGLRNVDIVVPTTVGVVIATAGLMSFTGHVAVNRERGFLRRLAATPLGPGQLAVGFAGSFLAIALVGVAAVLAAGTAEGMSAPVHPFAFAAAALLAAASMLSIGLLLGAVLPNARVAQAVASAVFFPMMFLSGMTTARELQSPAMRRIGEFMPLTHAVELLRRSWDGRSEALGGHVAVLVATTALAGVAGLRLFRWGAA
jgi:ABC-2 type transport system permease protein